MFRAFLERFFDGLRADYGVSYFDLFLILTFILWCEHEYMTTEYRRWSCLYEEVDKWELECGYG